MVEGHARGIGDLHVEFVMLARNVGAHQIAALGHHILDAPGKAIVHPLGQRQIGQRPHGDDADLSGKFAIWPA
jgi:hypothetical protein